MEAERKYWGPIASIALGLAVMVAFALTQTLVFTVAAVLSTAGVPGADINVVLEQLRWSGPFFAVVLWVSSPLALLFVLLLIRLRKGVPAPEYLALRTSNSRREWLIWLGVLGAVILVSDLTTVALGRPVVPEFMRQMYASTAQTPVFLPALWTAVILAAPLLEEVLFRGFLYRGLAESPKVGPAGAVFLTTLFWTGIHQQYGIYELAQVFVLGMVIGLARWKTGSLRVSLLMHACANLVATVQAALLT